MQKQTVHYMVDEFSSTMSKAMPVDGTYRGAGFAIWERRWGLTSFSMSDMSEVKFLVRNVGFWKRM